MDESPTIIAAVEMRKALHRRFSICFTFDYSRLSYIYFASTYLDYRHRHVLTAEEIAAAKQYLESLYPPQYTFSIENNVNSDGSESNNDSNNNTLDTDSMDECTALSLLSTYGKSENRTSDTDNRQLAHPIIAEFDQYDNYPTPINHRSPIDTWNELLSTGRAPVLSSIALDILSIPASSASVERLFSAAGRAKNVVRSRLGESAIEKECLIRLNRFVLDDE